MVALVIALGLLVAPQAPTATATSSITVQVRETGTGAPVPGARITITGPGVRETATADGAGKYAFTGLAAGTYRFVVERESFAFDPTGPGMIDLGSGVQLGVVLEMQRAAAITGEVRDEQGNPRAGLNVTAIRRVGNGTSTSPTGRQPTNDLGEFRVDGLLPGEYLIIASPATAVRDTILMPTYYPATTEKDAAIPIRVGPGDTISGISIRVASSPSYEITGTVVDEAGRPLRAVISFVFEAVQTWMPGKEASTRATIRALVSRQDGTFRITGLGPGTYRLTPSQAPATLPPTVPPELMLMTMNGTSSTVSVVVRDANASDVKLVLRGSKR